MKDVLYESQKIIATKNKEKIRITSPLDIEKIEQIQEIKNKVQEHFLVITLNNKNFVNSIELVGIGSTTSIPMDISDIIRCAVIRGSTAIIVAHNHPSGDSTPSRQDIYFTKRLNTVASYLNIRLLDHVIVGEKTLSMAKEELIDMDSDFYKLENSVINELKEENIKLQSKIEKFEKKESISDKVEKAKEKAQEQVLNGRGRDPFKIERDCSTL